MGQINYKVGGAEIFRGPEVSDQVDSICDKLRDLYQEEMLRITKENPDKGPIYGLGIGMGALTKMLTQSLVTLAKGLEVATDEQADEMYVRVGQSIQHLVHQHQSEVYQLKVDKDKAKASAN